MRVHCHSESGQTLVQTALLVMVLVALAVLATDLSSAYLHHRPLWRGDGPGAPARIWMLAGGLPALDGVL